MIKLAIVTTHPIQYNAPWFKMLAQMPGIEVKVFYTWEQSERATKFDPGFGKAIKWDLPLLEGYQYTFVKNISKSPGSHHYKGIKNPTLNAEIEEWGAGAVLVFGWAFSSHLSCLRYFKNRIPVLFRGDSTLLNEQPGFKKLLRRYFLKYVYSHVDYALYVGTNNKKYFAAHGMTDSQLVFVPHAIDNERFAANSEVYENDALKWKQDLRINKEHFTVLYAGKFDYIKNPGYILELAKCITGNNFRFILVGNGPLEHELKLRASQDDRIIFLDFQNQKLMPVVYRLGDVVVLSSESETWGLAVNEAIACDRPVLTNNKVGCAVDMIVNNQNGLVTQKGDISDAVDYIMKISTDNTLYKKMKDVNNPLIEIYSFDNIVSSVSKLLHSLQKNN